MSKSGRKSGSRNTILSIVFIIGIIAIYFGLKEYMTNPPATEEIIVSEEYILLENNDTVNYEAVVMYNNNININTVAKTFYNSDVFWPYIFVENKNVTGVKTNPLDIPKGSVLKIPRLTGQQLDLIDTISVYKAKAMADSILNSMPTF